MARLVILRPEPAASATAERARAESFEVVKAPLFILRSVAWQAPDPSAFDALLLTSANAMRHGGEQLQRLCGLPVHAVGEATAEAAREAGFDVASTGSADVDRLLGSIEPDLRLLHLCGADRRTPSQPRQHITALCVYRADATEQPDLGELAEAVALVHSPRAAARLAELVKDRSSVTIVAISAAAAEAAGSGWREVAVADAPSDAALLATAARLCNNANRR